MRNFSWNVRKNCHNLPQYGASCYRSRGKFWQPFLMEGKGNFFSSSIDVWKCLGKKGDIYKHCQWSEIISMNINDDKVYIIYSIIKITHNFWDIAVNGPSYFCHITWEQYNFDRLLIEKPTRTI